MLADARPLASASARDEQTIATVEVPAVPKSATQARTWLRASASRCDTDALDRAELVLSELLTNALIHTDSTTVTLACKTDAARIVVTVLDQGSQPASLYRRAPEDDDIHGRGLALVEALSEEWHWQWMGHGTLVQAAIALTALSGDTLTEAEEEEEAVAA